MISGRFGNISISPGLSAHTSVGLTSCNPIVFFSFEYFDPFDGYAACWVTSKES